MQSEGGTGYGLFGKRNRKVCYACCGERDRKTMVTTGKAVLYLTHGGGEMTGVNVGGSVSNWPGTLKFMCSVRIGRHNIAGKRYDVWFTGPDGKQWHGVTYGGNTQLCRCKRVAA